MKNKNNINPEEHLGLVHMCCKKFKNKNIEYEDLFQAGCEGLSKAAKNFDINKNTKFSTYAVILILGEIKNLFRNNNYLKISRKTKELFTKIQIEREKFININSREPTIQELSEIFNINSEDILEALEFSQIPIPLENYNYNNNLNNININKNYISSNLEEKISLKITVFNIIKNLDSRDKNIIYLRFFKFITQSEVAKKLNMTQVQVSRREKFILNFIRNKLE